MSMVYGLFSARERSMPDSSSDLRSFENVFCLLLMVFNSGLLSELSGQELKLLVATAIYQAAEDRRAWRTTVTELEQLLAVSNKTVNKALDSLISRRLLKRDKAKRTEYHRAAKPFWLKVDPSVVERPSWPALTWADVDRLAKDTIDWLNKEYVPKPVFNGSYVLGTRKTSD